MSIFGHSNGAITSYTYNADGIRTLKRYYDENAEYLGVTKYTLDGNKIVAENRLGTQIYYTYDDKGAIMGMIYGGESYVFAKNLQGDVIGIYNEDGILLAKYEYSSFGEVIAITNASGNDVSGNSTHIANVNPFRYRGYYYDTETGFYYLNSRYYDPVVGRFLNADVYVSTGQGILGNNMFAYCNNNPVCGYDPLGLCSICDSGACGPCSDLFYKEQEKKQKTKASYVTPSKCPPAALYEITKLDIPERYSAVKVAEDSSGCSYLGSYTSYPYIVFRFANRGYTSDYYFVQITVEQKLNRLGIEKTISYYAMKGSSNLSDAGAVNGAPLWLELVANACGVANPFMKSWYYNVQGEIKFYESMEGAAYAFQFVKTYKTHDLLRGIITPIVYP